MSTIGRPVARLSGYAPALPTPFNEDGSLDQNALEQICERQIRLGADALVVCGTSGEAPTLSSAEHATIVRAAVRISHGRVPVVAGAGSNSTAHAIALTAEAEAAGADAILSVVPYYNKPTQAGLYAHFRAIGQSTGLPIIAYDVPSRTACGLADETVARLAEMEQFIGLKDATGDISRPARLRPLVGPDFRLLSGDDATALAFFAMGGDGCISVTSNIAPRLCGDMFRAYASGRVAGAQRLGHAVALLTAALFRETNPVPLKYAMSLFGLMSPRVRLPLVELSLQAEAQVARVVMQVSDLHPESMIASIAVSSSERHKAAAA